MNRRSISAAAAAALVLLGLLCADVVRAQPTHAEGVLERARAIRPVNLVAGQTLLHAQHYDNSAGRLPGPRTASPGAQFFAHRADARAAMESVLLRATYVGTVTSSPLSEGPQNLALARSGNPEIGAYFRDRPAPGWRYELGGSIAIPAAAHWFLASGPRSDPTLPLDNLVRARGPS